MAVNLRPYASEEDYWRLREFLRQVYLFNRRRQLSWHVARLEYARYHVFMNCHRLRIEDFILIWEGGDGEIIAALVAEGPGDIHLQIHPSLHTSELEEEMVRTAQERLAVLQPNGRRKLTLWAEAKDLPRQELLLRRGFVRGEEPESQWIRSLDAPIPDAPLAPGYTVRSLGDGLELLERCYASGLGFHAGDIRIAVENRDDPTWYRNIQTAQLYRRDLDLVAVAPDGAIAAFCTIWFDDVTRSAYFEPVATVPAHQRRGLARAVMTEGLRRLQRMGALVATVGGYSVRANALYSSVLSPEHDLQVPWKKFWD